MANRNGEIRVWSIPDGHERYRGQTDPGVLSIVRPGQSGFMTLTSTQNHALAQWWPFTSGQPQPIGSFEVRRPFAATYDALAYSVENAIHVRSLRDRNARPTSIVAPGTLPMTLALSPDGSEVATADATRDIRIWSVSTPPLGLKRVIQAPAAVVGLTYGSSGQSLIAWSFEHGYPTFAVFDLAGPENTNPTLLVKGDTNNAGGAALDPTANWMATTHGSEVAFWPLASHRNRVLRLDVPAAHVYFSSDGKRLLTALVDGTVQDRPLHAGQTRVLRKTSRDDSAPVFGMAVAPDGRQLAVSGLGEIVEVLDLATGSWRQVRGVRPVPFMGRAAFSEDGRLLAAGVGAGLPGTKRLFVWDLESGEMKTFGPFTATGERREGGIASVEFVGNHTVLASVVGHGIVAVDLTTGANRLVAAKVAGEMAFTRDGRLGFVVQERESARRTGAELFRLQADGEAQPVLSHGKVVTAVTLDPTEQWVASGSFDGTIRIGPVSGGDPHLLLGQEGGGAVYSLAFSPDGQWIAASGEGFRLYLCTVPDLTKPPIHRLAHDALLTLFRTHTNLAAIPDASAPNGYRLEVGPFPGWAHLPQW
jgi:WD40 repeat protein